MAMAKVGIVEHEGEVGPEVELENEAQGSRKMPKLYLVTVHEVFDGKVALNAYAQAHPELDGYTVIKGQEMKRVVRF